MTLSIGPVAAVTLVVMMDFLNGCFLIFIVVMTVSCCCIVCPTLDSSALMEYTNEGCRQTSISGGPTDLCLTNCLQSQVRFFKVFFKVLL